MSEDGLYFGVSDAERATAMNAAEALVTAGELREELLPLLTFMLVLTFYPFASPRAGFELYFASGLGASFAISGYAYLCSAALPATSAPLTLVFPSVVFLPFSRLRTAWDLCTLVLVLYTARSPRHT